MRKVLFATLMFITCNGLAHAAPLQGGVTEEGTGSSGTPQSPQSALLDQLQAQLQELKQLNARLEKAATGGTALTPKNAFPMKIGAADSRFRPNKLFAEAELPAEATEEGWYRIPYWRAGHYLREKQTDHSITGDVTITSRVEHVYGMQQDKTGGIWHHRSWPHITKVDSDGYTEYKIIEKYEPVEGAPNEFAFKVTSTDIDVDDKTHRIKRVTKQIEVDRYTPGPDHTAIGECEWQGYTMNGDQNTQIEHSTAEERQTEPFKIVNFWRNKDLKASFRDYLRSHNMADLIPDE